MDPVNRRLALSCSAAVACASLIGLRSGSALAQATRPDPEAEALRALVGAAPPSVEPWSRFTIDVGGGFILDRSMRGFALFKLDDDPEVWALRGSFGARGDEILRNDVSEIMLRVTEFGGATYYGPGDSSGRPALPVPGGEPLARPNSTLGSLQATVEFALDWFDRYDPGNVRVEAQAGLPPGLVLDTLRVTRIAMQAMGTNWFASDARKIRRIRIQNSARPVALLQAGFLGIGINPGLSYAGRPSSAVLRRVFAGVTS